MGTVVYRPIPAGRWVTMKRASGMLRGGARVAVAMLLAAAATIAPAQIQSLDNGSIRLGVDTSKGA
jgi:hypothetical protein